MCCGGGGGVGGENRIGEDHCEPHERGHPRGRRARPEGNVVHCSRTHPAPTRGRQRGAACVVGLGRRSGAATQPRHRRGRSRRDPPRRPRPAPRDGPAGRRDCLDRRPQQTEPAGRAHTLRGAVPPIKRKYLARSYKTGPATKPWPLDESAVVTCVRKPPKQRRISVPLATRNERRTGQALPSFVSAHPCGADHRKGQVRVLWVFTVDGATTNEWRVAIDPATRDERRTGITPGRKEIRRPNERPRHASP